MATTKKKSTTNKRAQKQASRSTLAKGRIISIGAVIIVVSFILYKAFFSLSSATYVTSAFGQGSPMAELCPSAQESLQNASIREYPLIDPLYQKQLSAITFLSPNLVENPTFTTDGAADSPDGYNHNDDSARSSYALGAEAGVPYVRATNLQKVPVGSAAAGWVMTAIPLLKTETYMYKIAYRSSVDVIVTIDTIKDGEHTYRDVAKLPAKDGWTSYYGIFDNGDEQADAIRLISSSREKGTVDVAPYSVGRVRQAQLPRGMVSLTFDDGWKSIYEEASPILDEFGYKSTQYIISDAVDYSIPAYMDAGQISAMQDNGHEIGSHSLQHCDMAQLSQANMHLFADSSYDSLSKKWGNITSFAYPFGSYSSDSQKIFSTKYQYLRSTDGGLNDRYFDRQHIYAYTVHKNMTDKEYKGLLDKAVASKKWLVLVYHGVGNDSDFDVTADQLKNHLNMVRESGLDVRPLTAAGDSIKALP